MQGAETRRGRMAQPMRRAQPGDASSFLIDGDHGQRRQHAGEMGRQGGHLRRILDIARKQDDAGGTVLAE